MYFYKRKKMKNIIINGIVLSIVIMGNLFISASSIANEGTSVTATYEQITKQYPSMVQYIAKARKDIKNNWYPPAASFENSTTVILTIKKDGTLTNCSLAIPSPNNEFNNSLIEAAKKTTFAPLPEDVKEESVDIDLSFEMKRRHILNNKLKGE